MISLSKNKKTIFICCAFAGAVLGTTLATWSFSLDKSEKSPIATEDPLAQERQLIYKEIMDTAKYNNPKLTAMELLEIAQSVYISANEFEVDYQLILAVISQESHFRLRAVSYKGAQGLMQVMPATGKAIARDLELENYQLNEISTNIRFGTYYLSQLFDQYEDPHAVLTAYNRGPTGLKNYVRRTGTTESSYSREILGYLH